MKKAISLIILLVLTLFVIGEIFGFKTGILEKRIDLYVSDYVLLKKENRNLNVQYYNSLNLSRIDRIACTKLKMLPTDSYVIMEISNAR